MPIPAAGHKKENKMSEKKNKFTRIGQIRKNTHEETGRVYKELVLEKSFLEDAPSLLKQCYTDKHGCKHLYLFDANDNAPDFVVADICIKTGE